MRRSNGYMIGVLEKENYENGGESRVKEVTTDAFRLKKHNESQAG